MNMRKEIYNSLLELEMIKLVYGSKNKIVKHGNKGFFQLRNIIKSNFPEAPVDYSLTYLDEDKDQICINSDEDLVNMLNSMHSKVHKVYIKQSLSQTVVLDLQRSDYIETTESIVVELEKEEEKRHNPFAEPEIEEKKVKDQEVIVSHDFKKVQLESAKDEVTQIKLEEFSEYEKTEVKIQSDKVEPQELPKEDKIEAVQKEEKLIQSEEIAKPIQEIKLTFDAAIQSQVIELEDEKKVESIKMEVDPSRFVISSSREYKVQEGSSRKSGPSISEHSMNVTSAKIFGKVEEVKDPQIKESNGELLFHEVICSCCKDEFGIIGIRYQCILCDHFNLCSKCEAEYEHQHALVKVKNPKLAIMKDDLIKKFKKEIYADPQEVSLIPDGHYVPSIDKKDSERVINAARDAFKQGMDRSNKLMEELFFKLETSHKNPYEVAKPAPPEKIQTVYEKAKYLQDLMGLSYNQAQKFVAQYPRLNSQKIVEIYFGMKNP